MNVLDLFNLKNKIVLVTGGAGNYGRSITEGLGEAGATVIIASRNLEAIEKVAAGFRSGGLDVQGMQVDQADTASVLALKTSILNKFGKLDVFINNAVSRPMKGYNAPIEQFDESMRVNATGMMFILREMTNLIINSGGGSVINISSMMGMYAPMYSNYDGIPGMGDIAPDYCFHNAGLIMLTRFMAKTHAGKNIRFNCISPGGLFNNQPGKFVENYCKKVPVGRMANNDDIKGLIVLLSSEAGAYINGENILIDGGLNA
ncbi:SDR family oxidoreductase [Agriterribacter sp.]|uniref:SDR family NAD(P)-dependent oxidoreductase n=1 Tax=Agriterribacter sp. TaxID=2821509 RepID=UPI002D0B08B3|nr:SDR family oxidoreductase [Agriterribacter sp.]HRO46514.1 SDR family oxidoreductase [Agriterribacter sp.]HRQ17557.1 SDR family oxidoreductase [Agriterribacter sp.]